jgi:hypothetical protein
MAGVHAKIRALTIAQRRAARSCAILWMTCMGKGVVGSDGSGRQILVALLAPAKGRCSAGAEVPVPPKRAPGRRPAVAALAPGKRLKLQKELIAARDRQAVKPLKKARGCCAS